MTKVYNIVYMIGRTAYPFEARVDKKRIQDHSKECQAL